MERILSLTAKMSELGQIRKSSIRANVFRSSPKADVPAETHWDVPHSKSNIMRRLLIGNSLFALAHADSACAPGVHSMDQQHVS